MNTMFCVLLFYLLYRRCDAKERLFTPNSNNLDQYNTDATPLTAALYGFEVIPDVISLPLRWSAIVRFPDGENLYLGYLILARPTAEPRPPSYVSWPRDPSKNYTFIFVDPDIPSRENATEGQFILWLLINVPGGNFRDGRTVVNYAVTPTQYQIGLHRYIFLIYEQNTPLNLNMNSKKINRLRFSVSSFARRYQLGYPVAGNFGRVQYGEPTDTENEYYCD